MFDLFFVVVLVPFVYGTILLDAFDIIIMIGVTGVFLRLLLVSPQTLWIPLLLLCVLCMLSRIYHIGSILLTNHERVVWQCASGGKAQVLPGSSHLLHEGLILKTEDHVFLHRAYMAGGLVEIDRFFLLRFTDAHSPQGSAVVIGGTARSLVHRHRIVCVLRGSSKPTSVLDKFLELIQI